MGTDKPLISILMAVYEPRMDWLEEQLCSLNAQTYPNLRLYIRDDCSPQVPIGEIEALVRKCVTAFPYTIARNKRNLGSNDTFERLTREAEGEYFAYCDQDDVWLPEKLSVLQNALDRQGSVMAYSDMMVMDGKGRLMASSLREIRPRLRYVEGKNLGRIYFFRNCTAGCSMLVRGEAVKWAVPFPQETVCDQWIALAAALRGEIIFVNQSLVRYRQHGGNQTGILTGVTSREDYRRVRLEPLRERLAALRRLATPPAEMERFVTARLEGNRLEIWKYRSLSPEEAKFELLTGLLPEKLFEALVRKIK